MIRISGEWIIDSAPCNYILAREVSVIRKDKKTQEECQKTELRDQTFHRTIEQAATAYLRRVQREFVHNNDLPLREAISALQTLTETVQLQLKEVLP